MRDCIYVLGANAHNNSFSLAALEYSDWYSCDSREARTTLGRLTRETEKITDPSTRSAVVISVPRMLPCGGYSRRSVRFADGLVFVIRYETGIRALLEDHVSTLPRLIVR